jgi:predicted ATPase
MISIDKLRITGYKSIARCSLSLNDLNVIVGANGSGKSNLLSALTLLRDESYKLAHINYGSAPEYLFHLGFKVTQQIKVDVEYQGVGCSASVHLKRGEAIGAFNTTQSMSGMRKNVIPDDLDSVRLGSLSEAIKHLSLFNFHDTGETSPAKKTAALHDNRTFRNDASNLPAFLYLLQENHALQFDRIQDCIRLVAPYFEAFILSPLLEKNSTEKIKLEWKQKGSDAYFDAYSLSDGTLRFLCLATLLMQPEPPALILLDEPELGLHPFAITLLAEMLEDAAVKSQVILATQSVTLLNWMKLENIIVAEHDGQATSFKRLDEEALTPWLDEYSMGDLWEKNLIGGRP